MSRIVFGLVGLCAGFVLCYVYRLVPETGLGGTGPPSRSELIAAQRSKFPESLTWGPSLAELHQKLPRTNRDPFNFPQPTSDTHGVTEIGIERIERLFKRYTFVVKHDGTFRYHGEGSVKHYGKFAGKIRGNGFHYVANAIVEAGYMDMHHTYDWSSHGTKVYIMVVLNGQTNVVLNRGGYGPPKLWAIERLIDSLMTDVDRWHRVQ